MTFRTPAAETEGELRKIRFALISTCAILVQLKEDMLHLQPTETRRVIRAERNRAAPWPDENRRGIEPAIHLSVVIVSLRRRRRPQAAAFISIKPSCHAD